ncbi:MAG: MFS transporter [Acidimicrobiales bacterium]
MRASSNLPELVVTRILQGVGGGMMVPTGMTMLYRAYPQDRRVHVARLITAVMVLAPATAPVIGGSLVTWASWRWIFVIPFLDEHREPPRGRFDLPGALLGGSGRGRLLYSIGEARPPVGLPRRARTLVAALALAVAFVTVELRQENPGLDLRLLGDRMLRRFANTIGPQSVASSGRWSW